MYALGWCLSIQDPQASKGPMLNSKAGCQNKRMGE